jgi:hypothetical protein
MTEPIGLAELIAKIKDELQEAQESDKVFIIERIEIEVKVGVIRTNKQQEEAEAKTGLQLQVIPFLPFTKAEASAGIKATESLEMLITII